MDALTGSIGTVTFDGDANVSPTGVSATGGVGTPNIWSLIDDEQTPNWAAISDSQTPSWSTIDDSQTPNWEEVA
jgi:hypothetical protein